MSALEAPARAPRPLIAVWVGGMVAAALLGGFAATHAHLLGLAAIAALGVAVVLVAFAEPRWLVFLEILALSSYAVYVLPLGPVTPETLVLLGIFGVALRWVLRFEAPRLPETEMLLVGALLLVTVASSFVAIDPAASGVKITALIKNGLLVLLIVTVIDRGPWLRRAMWAYVLGAGFMATVNVLQQGLGNYGQTFHGFAAVDYDRSLVRSAGPLSPNFFGQMLVACGVLSVYLGLSSKRRSTKLVAYGITVASIGGIAFSYSRASLLVAVLLAPAIALLRGVRPATVISSMAVVIVVAFSILIPSSGAFRGSLQSLYKSVTSNQPSTDVSVSGRLSEQIAAWRMFAAHPILGVGAGNYPDHYLDYSEDLGLDQRGVERTPHNLYLETLASTGIVGGLVFGALLWAAVAGAWRARRLVAPEEMLVVEGCFVAMVAFLANSFFLHLAYDAYFWLVLALALSARRVGERAAREARA